MQPPKILEAVRETCPNCKCQQLFLIEAEVPPAQCPPQLILMPGHKIYATYAGCAACPWTSKAMLTPRKEIDKCSSDSADTPDQGKILVPS